MILGKSFVRWFAVLAQLWEDAAARGAHDDDAVRAGLFSVDPGDEVVVLPIPLVNEELVCVAAVHVRELVDVTQT